VPDQPRLSGERHDRSVDDEAERLAGGRDAIAPSSAPGGQASSTAGGYGSGSGVQSSGGTGEGTDDTSTAGEEAQTDWLRDAPGGGGDRG